jgi:hypothetical protein
LSLVGPDVERRIDLARIKDCRGRNAGGIDIRVEQIVAADVHCCKDVVEGERVLIDLDPDLARRHVGKRVRPVGQGGHAGTRLAVGANQGDLNVGDSRLAGVLDPVFVGVVPHSTRQRRG